MELIGGSLLKMKSPAQGRAKPRRALAGFFMCGVCPIFRLAPDPGRFGFFAAHPETPFYLFMSTTCTGGQDIHNRATGEVLRALLR